MVRTDHSNRVWLLHLKAPQGQLESLDGGLVPTQHRSPIPSRAKTWECGCVILSEVSDAYSYGVNLADLPVEDANTVRGLTRIWGTSPMTSWGWIGPTLGIPKVSSDSLMTGTPVRDAG